MHVFGLTGGIASGKSAVARHLRKRNVPVLDADAIAREVVEPGTPGFAAVVEAFGDAVVGADGSLDRKKLAAVVFGDEAKRKRLNGIVHPLVTSTSFARAQDLGAQGEALVCYEAALIVENGVADAFRPLVVVAVPEATQVARACARDGASEAEVRARIAAQMPLAEKVKQADFVIENVGSLADLEAKTDAVLLAICRRLGIPHEKYLPDAQ